MELMDRSLEELYHLVYDKLEERIPELVIGKMALSVSTMIACTCDIPPLHLFPPFLSHPFRLLKLSLTFTMCLM